MTWRFQVGRFWKIVPGTTSLCEQANPGQGPSRQATAAFNLRALTSGRKAVQRPLYRTSRETSPAGNPKTPRRNLRPVEAPGKGTPATQAGSPCRGFLPPQPSGRVPPPPGVRERPPRPSWLFSALSTRTEMTPLCPHLGQEGISPRPRLRARGVTQRERPAGWGKW